MLQPELQLSDLRSDGMFSRIVPEPTPKGPTVIKTLRLNVAFTEEFVVTVIVQGDFVLKQVEEFELAEPV